MLSASACFLCDSCWCCLVQVAINGCETANLLSSSNLAGGNELPASQTAKLIFSVVLCSPQLILNRLDLSSFHLLNWGQCFACALWGWHWLQAAQNRGKEVIRHSFSSLATPPIVFWQFYQEWQSCSVNTMNYMLCQAVILKFPLSVDWEQVIK